MPKPPPSTLTLAFLWIIFGPGLLMPLFFLAPDFFKATESVWGDRFRIGGSIGYLVVSAAVLIPLTWRYQKGAP